MRSPRVSPRNPEATTYSSPRLPDVRPSGSPRNPDVAVTHEQAPRGAGHAKVRDSLPKEQELAELEAGDSLHIGENEYYISCKLGAGSFATVWSAFSDCGKVAIKEIICRSNRELSNALMERDILKSMGTNQGTEQIGKTPLLLGSAISQGNDPEAHQVHLAMTLLPGRQLDGFLSEQFRMAPTEPRDAYHQFFNSCHYARQLLNELAPACTQLSTLVRHRDISPRNILIDVADGVCPHYGLVDFGHAVEADKWPMGSTANDLAGDGRYWTVSAWYVFEHGLQELAKDPLLFAEYQSHIDLHALGISAVQTLMSMSPRLTDADMECLSEGSGCADEVLISLRMLQLAWENYWGTSCKYFKAIFDACQGVKTNGLKLLQEVYKMAGVHDIISNCLEQVRCAVQRLREAYEQMPDELDVHEVLSLLDALLLMICTPGSAPSCPAWQDLQSILDRSRDARRTWVAVEHACDETKNESLGNSATSTVCLDSSANSNLDDIKIQSPRTPLTVTPTSSVCLDLHASVHIDQNNGDECLGSPVRSVCMDMPAGTLAEAARSFFQQKKKGT